MRLKCLQLLSQTVVNLFWCWLLVSRNHRFSPAVLSGHLVAVADIAVGDATRDTVQLRQVAAGILGMILILTTVR